MGPLSCWSRLQRWQAPSLPPRPYQADEKAAPIFGAKVWPGYRDWKLISVAHEAGNRDELRAIPGKNGAMNAYREGKLPFPAGTIMAQHKANEAAQRRTP
jgi:hypothetical protein